MFGKRFPEMFGGRKEKRDTLLDTLNQRLKEERTQKILAATAIASIVVGVSIAANRLDKKEMVLKLQKTKVAVKIGELMHLRIPTSEVDDDGKQSVYDLTINPAGDEVWAGIPVTLDTKTGEAELDTNFATKIDNLAQRPGTVEFLQGIADGIEKLTREDSLDESEVAEPS